MFHIVIFLACLALNNGHLVVPIAHSAKLVAPYHGHGYGFLGYGHGYGHGYGAYGSAHGDLGHHIWKRSPHFVAPYSHGNLGHVAVAPVAVSHQSRVDVHSSPAVVPPVVPVVVAPHHGIGHLGAGYYGAGHYGAGIGHYDFSHLGHY